MTQSLRSLFWGSLFLKLILALIVPLALDEYYYFLWGNQLSLSYYDHPPLVGWLMFFSQPLKHLAEGGHSLAFYSLGSFESFILAQTFKN
jgi:hypothetical protein